VSRARGLYPSLLALVLYNPVHLLVRLNSLQRFRCRSEWPSYDLAVLDCSRTQSYCGIVTTSTRQRSAVRADLVGYMDNNTDGSRC